MAMIFIILLLLLRRFTPFYTIRSIASIYYLFSSPRLSRRLYQVMLLLLFQHVTYITSLYTPSPLPREHGYYRINYATPLLVTSRWLFVYIQARYETLYLHSAITVIITTSLYYAETLPRAWNGICLLAYALLPVVSTASHCLSSCLSFIYHYITTGEWRYAHIATLRHRVITCLRRRYFIITPPLGFTFFIISIRARHYY